MRCARAGRAWLHRAGAHLAETHVTGGATAIKKKLTFKTGDGFLITFRDNKRGFIRVVMCVDSVLPLNADEKADGVFGQYTARVVLVEPSDDYEPADDWGTQDRSEAAAQHAGHWPLNYVPV